MFEKVADEKLKGCINKIINSFGKIRNIMKSLNKDCSFNKGTVEVEIKQLIKEKVKENLNKDNIVYEVISTGYDESEKEFYEIIHIKNCNKSFKKK